MKNTHIWLPEYLRTRRTRAAAAGLRHLMFCMVDHYEPDVGGAPLAEQLARVERWVTEYPRLAARHRDADGRPPRYSFFYPVEVYEERVVARLAALCREGLAEIEIHLHHDGDTGKTLAATLEEAKARLVRHGLLARDRATGRARFGFIHGNWALDNSRPDGKWCGVNNELTILQQAGCYADFTMPSAPSVTQTRKINSLYYAHDDPERPKSHDTGTDAAAGARADGGLLMIQGPLTLNWHRRKFGLLPRIENGELSRWNPPTPRRADLWVNERIGVRGKPEWVFVKVFTHGAKPGNDDVILGRPMDALFTHLEAAYNDGAAWKLHYVTAREMYNLVKAAERGVAKDPGQHLDEELLPPMGRA